MKSSVNKISILFSFSAILFLISCKKDSAEQLPDVLYTVNIDGYTATFDNKTEGGESFKWEFGDGATSTEKSPVHAYQGKGKFVPTLYVTTTDGKTIEGSTVLRIAKSTSVKMADNSLSDWDTVIHNVVTSGAGGGIFRKAKYDYDGNNVYFYFEMVSAEANGDIFDFYMDTDNDPTTGLVTWLFGNAGNDVLIEGAALTGWFDLFYHKGEQTAFTFEPQPIAEFFEIGTIQESGGILTFEGKLTRSKIKGLVGTGFKIGVAATKNDWSAMLGAAPDPGALSFFVDMSE